jgi:alpha-ketoglutaric semialdehyde dehydrogenase
MNQYRNLINGEWVTGDQWRPNVSPSDSNDVIGEYADADALQAETAAAAAREAFRSWS